MRWLAVRRRALGPIFERAGQGIGSFLLLSGDVLWIRAIEPGHFAPSVLARGLVAPETVDGIVAEQDAALEALEL